MLSLPPGYSFVRKGNVYITGNCRKMTQAVHQTVYSVLDGAEKQIGIAVPAEIFNDVRRKESETRADRAANVKKRDASIEKDFEKVILQEYPRIPCESLPKVLKTALQKRKGKVGRTGTLASREKARLAVRAHIRHAETAYDQLLRSGKTRDQARDVVGPQVDSIARSWGQHSASQPVRRPKSGRAKKAGQAENAATAKSLRSAPREAPAAEPSSPKSPETKLVDCLAQSLVATSPRQSHATGQCAQIPIIDLTGDDDDPPRLQKASPILKKKNKKLKKPQRQPLRLLTGRQRCVTRSMQRIEASVQELSQRLPDSPEPEPFV